MTHPANHAKTARALLGLVVLMEVGLSALLFTHPNVSALTWAYLASPLVLTVLLVLDIRASQRRVLWFRAAQLAWMVLLCGVAVLWIRDALWAALLVAAVLLPFRGLQLGVSLVAFTFAARTRAPS